MSKSIAERTVEIIAEQAMIDPSDVTLDQSLADLGVDSMGVVEAIFSIEEEFDIQVPFNANEPDKSDFDISSVGAVVDAVERLVAGRNG